MDTKTKIMDDKTREKTISDLRGMGFVVRVVDSELSIQWNDLEDLRQVREYLQSMRNTDQ